MRRLPPLNSLRAFEAVARNRSISDAARELFVTHSAVGRHVAKLEEYLGVKLFERDGNRLSLTPQGTRYAERLTVAFDDIQLATAENFSKASKGRLLRIGCYPTFANQVLIPRLARFREQHPDMPFEIQTSHTAFDPVRSDIDVAVWLGVGKWPGLVARHLLHEELRPVASPKLLRREDVAAPRDLAGYTLLHAIPRPDDWERWFATAGVMGVDAHQGLHFEHSGMVYQAAVNQLGIAMAQTVHVQEHIGEGRLICLCDTPLLTEQSYFLVYPHASAGDARIRAFERWIGAELAACATD